MDPRRCFDVGEFRVRGGKNKFRVKLGQWTDDTSMGLCLADSLLAHGTYVGSDTRVRYHNWWFRGYNNAFGNDDRRGSIGLGGNVAKSLAAMAPGEEPNDVYQADTEDSAASVGMEGGSYEFLELSYPTLGGWAQKLL